MDLSQWTMDNGQSKIKNQKSKIKNQKSKIKNIYGIDIEYIWRFAEQEGRCV